MEQPLGSTVSLRVQAVDRYGRSVAEVIGKGLINLAMVQSGQAFVYRQYLGRFDRGAYMAAERQAQAQRLGVWAVPGGTTRLWEFWHGGAGHRSPGAVPAAATSKGPSLDLRLSSPAGLRPAESRSVRLTRTRSCKGRCCKNVLTQAELLCAVWV
jgi:hypothetical protein